jgi:effector-binding domain-containing protein
MMTEPRIVTREPQPYAAIELELTQPEISQKAPHRIADVIKWANASGIALAGAPFFNYTAFKPGGRMVMQVGMPTATVGKAGDGIVTGTLPGGRYASLTHTGPYHELHEANMTLDKWAKDNGHALDGRMDGDGFRDAHRMEIYHKDPGEDPSGHPVTEVAFRLAD